MFDPEIQAHHCLLLEGRSEAVIKLQKQPGCLRGKPCRCTYCSSSSTKPRHDVGCLGRAQVFRALDDAGDGAGEAGCARRSAASEDDDVSGSEEDAFVPQRSPHPAAHGTRRRCLQVCGNLSVAWQIYLPPLFWNVLPCFDRFCCDQRTAARSMYENASSPEFHAPLQGIPCPLLHEVHAQGGCLED